MTTEAARSVGVTRTLYGAIGESNGEGRWQIRFYVHPFVSWIWAGCVIMALGGFISMTDARFRMPSRSSAPDLQAAPAE